MFSIKYLFFILLAIMSGASYSMVLTEIPESPDTQKEYLFLMFGLQTEIQGPDSFNGYYNRTYETTAITNAFASKGFIVITEIRAKGTVIEDYSKKVSDQVKTLIGKGVPPKNITVAGHSKGAIITLVTSGLISTPETKFIIMAGCALPTFTNLRGSNPRQLYLKHIKEFAASAKGKMLSIYDKEDEWFQTCKEFSDQAKAVSFTEKIIDTKSAPNKGHAAFYSVDPIWFDTVVKWIKE
jgi:hypothetical protein